MGKVLPPVNLDPFRRQIWQPNPFKPSRVQKILATLNALERIRFDASKAPLGYGRTSRDIQ